MARDKYTALARYLLEQQGSQVTLAMSEIEGIIGAPLPASAQVPAFWSNDARSRFPTWVWRSAGWRVAGRVYQPPGWVITFVREGTSTAREGPA